MFYTIMSEGKKSFVLYCDLIHTVEHLPDEMAGKLLKHILEYVNDKDPISNDVMLKLAFEPIKQSLKRDLVKYDSICNRNQTNGLKGGRPKKPKEPTGLNGNPKKPKKADSGNDTVSGNDTDTEIKVFNFKQSLLNYGFDKIIVNDWLEVRKNKKATNSETAYNQFINVIKRAEGQFIDKDKVLAKCVEKDWRGLEYAWLENIGMVKKWQSPI